MFVSSAPILAFVRPLEPLTLALATVVLAFVRTCSFAACALSFAFATVCARVCFSSTSSGFNGGGRRPSAIFCECSHRSRSLFA